MQGRVIYFLAVALLASILIPGCAHYPANQPLKEYNPAAGYRAKSMRMPGKSDDMLIFLTLSGGGTRAAAFSYGVLEVLANTVIVTEGKERRLLDEVDTISSVSGGSFTAGYYGLFGDRIFQDFEGSFLKKNIQGEILSKIFNPVNVARLLSPYFDRSDLAAEYYDRYIFDGGTIGDIAARKGPMIIINATDMTYGVRVGFTQDMFDMICSDLTNFPVARAVAASSAVPVILSPVTVRNYAGSCNYTIPEPVDRVLREHDVTDRQIHLVNSIKPYLDPERKPYLHLIDGGVADNLGLRAIVDRIIFRGDFWKTIRNTHHENVHKVIFIVVNAETQPDSKLDRMESPPALAAMLESYSTIAIERYNVETIALLKENLKEWAEQVRAQRCIGKTASTDPGSCGDMQFYIVEVKFDALQDEIERGYFKRLSTSFALAPEDVDNLRAAAGRILTESREFQRLLRDLRK
ncbi:MAG: patatin-like phospholipase family protein [Nitrospirae bacterium]|nr:patatin-like phospholipase family protein [Nitrospirota bacterium]